MPNESAVHDSHLLDQVVEQIIAQQHAGEHPQIDHYLERFPQLENEIREVWSVLMLVDQLSPTNLASSQSASMAASQLLASKSR